MPALSGPPKWSPGHRYIMVFDKWRQSLLFSSTLNERSSVHSQFTPTPLCKSRILPKQKASIEHLNKSTFPSGCLFLFFPNQQDAASILTPHFFVSLLSLHEMEDFCLALVLDFSHLGRVRNWLSCPSNKLPPSYASCVSWFYVARLRWYVASLLVDQISLPSSPFQREPDLESTISLLRPWSYSMTSHSNNLFLPMTLYPLIT